MDLVKKQKMNLKTLESVILNLENLMNDEVLEPHLRKTYEKLTDMAAIIESVIHVNEAK